MAESEKAKGMSERRRLGALVILSGPSGVGKSTVCRELFPRLARLRFSVSCTTRQPREGEVDGVHYHFLTREAFMARVAAGEFLEWAEVHGNCYGTLVSEVAPRLLAGDDVMLDIDVQGHEQLVARVRSQPDWGSALVSVFLAPPSFAVLEARLRGRATDSEETILRRLANARGELAQWRKYDYVIVNDDAAAAASRLEAVITAAHCRTGVQQEEPWA